MSSVERRQIEVSGTVQGVGFRPFVYRSAMDLGLSGWVRNTGAGVLIEAQGKKADVDDFIERISREAPPLAHVDRLKSQQLPLTEERDFEIISSAAACGQTAQIPPDIAPCEECIFELDDPANRRHRYPFINCVNCGPRYTIVRGLPYDRSATTMNSFDMCDACAAEYCDPTNRRFHAQPNACPECGPRVWLADASGEGVEGGSDPIAAAAAVLIDGKIVAIKGVGGFHLACAATLEGVVSELRARKRREAKPFAVMVRDLAAARELCELCEAEEELLSSPARPIVLLTKRPDARVANAVAPHNLKLGLMLPSSPLHHLLLSDTGIPLVMTSGNLSDEPIAFSNEEAMTRLCGIADLMLLHDREIHISCDDSVAGVFEGTPTLIRRGRGLTVEPMALPFDSPPLIAMGGDLKGSIVLAQGRTAFASQHLGDLSNIEVERALLKAAAHLKEIAGIRPGLAVSDLHPDYASTRLARELAAGEGLALVTVQHHHAHIASCMAEHGLQNEKVIGIALDGAGFGIDGAIWGGEILVADYTGFERAAHFRYVPQPGGDAAAREPWRMAIAYLMDAECMRPLPFIDETGDSRVQAVKRMIERDVQCIPTSSCGRLFDAAAALMGLCAVNRFEGEAAMRLEQAADSRDCGRYHVAIAGSEIDFRPMIRDIMDDIGRGTAAGEISSRIHASIADSIAYACVALRAGEGTLRRVCLSGGCMQNALLVRLLRSQLEQNGFKVFAHRLVPCNDGGIALGQAAIAGARFVDRTT